MARWRCCSRWGRRLAARCGAIYTETIKDLRGTFARLETIAWSELFVDDGDLPRLRLANVSDNVPPNRRPTLSFHDMGKRS